MNSYYLGVDVGTGSVRAGIFDGLGNLQGSGKQDIKIWRESGDIVEQSSDDIWQAVVGSVGIALKTSGVAPENIGGLGFDATCSLVLVDAEGKPVSVSQSGDQERNVIVWMDHRAMDQTKRINATHHDVLKYVGGVISPEMQTPKLLWLKENLPESYRAAAHFFDLSDYLTFRATGSLARSVCTVVCKWTYLAHEARWRADYFNEIGLGDLAAEDFQRIGTEILPPGVPIGAGLSAAAASELGLTEGTAVAASLIDAHAGALATLGGRDTEGRLLDPCRQVALIFGTSSSCMSLSRQAIMVPGMWGPYFSALTQEFWLTEGGQSAAGAALDLLVGMHPSLIKAGEKPTAELFSRLEYEVSSTCKSLSEVALIAKNLHILPDINGNRSPLADPNVRGVIMGIDMATDRKSLRQLYVAVLCGLAYGIAEIVAAQAARGFQIETITISGGGGRSALLRQIIADATGLRVCLPETEEPVLLGAAMLGAMAKGQFDTLEQAMAVMTRSKHETLPGPAGILAFHARKMEIYRKMQALERLSRA